jgi:hypothetical protein
MRHAGIALHVYDLSVPNEPRHLGTISFNDFHCRRGGTVVYRSGGGHSEERDGGPLVIGVEAGQTLWILPSIVALGVNSRHISGTGTFSLRTAGAGRAMTLTFTPNATAPPVVDGVVSQCWDPPPLPDPGPDCGNDCPN